MRVALVCSIPLRVSGGSGTAVAVRQLRSALAEAGHAVDTITPGSSRGGLTFTRWWFNRSLDPGRLAEKDVVLGVDGDAAAAAAAARRPYVAVLKGIYPEVLPYEAGLTRRLLQVQGRWERRASRAASAVVVPSRYSADAVRRHYRVPSSRLHVVPEPFDLDAWRRRLPAAERLEAVLCVAHLYPRKRVPDLLAAWPAVARQRPGTRLRIVGHGPESRTVSRLAAGLAGVTVEGHLPRDELMKAFASSAVFCLPSAQENFGIAAVEAMASGLVVVAAAAAAVPETTEGAVRRLVPVGDRAALSAALLAALDGEERRRAEVLNPELIRRYSPASVSEQLEAVLSEVRGR